MRKLNNSSGFTLIEVLIVIAIIAISATIATMEFSGMKKKSDVEAQIRQMATDINEVRIRAITTKQRHSITLNKYSYVFKAYSTDTWTSTAELAAHGTVIPGGTHNVTKYGLKSSVTTSSSVDYAGTIIEINERGMISNVTNSTVFLGGAAKTSGGINCLTIHTLRVNVGKENDTSGTGVCDDE